MMKKQLFWFIVLVSLASTSILNAVAWEMTLFSESNVIVTEHQVRFWGSFVVEAGTTLRIDWSADREVTVAVLDEVDYQEDHSWTIIHRQIQGEGQSGFIDFPVQNTDRFYIAVQPPITIDAKMYSISAKIVSGLTPTPTPTLSPIPTLTPFQPNKPIEILTGIVFMLAVIIAMWVALLLRKRRH